MNESNNNNTGCKISLDVIGFVLTVVFIILKLCNKISWSWVWVVSPMWISLLITLISWIIVTAIVSSFVNLFKHK